jgi:hypothetical protein
MMLTLAAGLMAADAKRPAGKLQSGPGSLLTRSAQGWQVVGPTAEVSSGETLLALPGDKANILSRDGAIRLTLWGNLPEVYDYPLLESEVILHPDPAVDLDLTLSRGRVVLTALKPKAAARVRFLGNSYDLQLNGPGTEVALELYGRWPSGAPLSWQIQRAEERRENVPVQVLLVYTLKGAASLKIGAEQFLMPAPASFRWDNVVGRERIPTRNAKLPSWTQGAPNTPEARDAQKAAGQFQLTVVRNGVSKAIADALRGTDVPLHRVAVFSMGAIDDLPALVNALGNPSQPDVRSAAVRALQHWIGQGPTQDQKLRTFLMNDRQFSDRQADIVLHLLHGFRDTDRNRPETYETLIEYLRNSKVPIRELASWYLQRWVPAGRGIAYDAGGNAKQIEQAYQEWKKLIPNGQLPPRGKP